MRRRAAVVARENTIVFSYKKNYSPSACYVAAWPRLGLAVPTCRPKELAAARNFGEEQACWRLAAQHGVSAAQDSVPIHRKRGGQHGLGELRACEPATGRQAEASLVYAHKYFFKKLN